VKKGTEQLSWGQEMPFCKNFNAKAVPCQGEKGECMAYPCNDWEQIMQTELDGTFYTELPAFRWPKRHGKRGKGAKEKRALARRAGNGAVATEDDEL
jgi:hypothetical protein